jgi:putative N6-adenine-specific DNA methylase
LEPTATGTEPQTFIVKTISGLEQVLANELAELGGTNIEILTRAVSFEGDKRLLYKANYCLRTALRILVPIYSFQMADEDDLYNQINDYPWENHLSLLKTLAVDAVVSGSELTHSHYVALRTKDAIVDRFRTLNNGRRPNVDTENPHVRVNIHIKGSICNVSIDSSGVSLHKRGYRVSNAEAPMSEVLAAGLIMLSGWKRDCHFIDPMCGSGTLLIEAAMYANNFPAGMYRKEFGFMNWPDFDQNLWDEVVTEAQDKQTEFEYQIIGSDISSKNLASARVNLKSARLHKDVKISVGAFADLKPPKGEPGIIIINPPYGERIRSNDIIGLYKSIGNTLKQEFAGYQAWIISSDQKALGFIGLRPTAKLPVFNGPLECRFEHFDLYKGSKRGRYLDTENQLPENLAEYSNPDGKASWRSKEAPAMEEMEPLPFKPRDFKPRNETSERKSSRFESKEGGYPEKKPFKRDNEPGKSEFKSREFKPRTESGDISPVRGNKADEGRDFRKTEKPDRDSSFRKDDRAERRKVEKVKLKPITRIEERGEQPTIRKSAFEFVAQKPEDIDTASLPETPSGTKPQREPSKGNKFTEQRDYKIQRTRELRPRKPKPSENEKETPQTKPEPKPAKPSSPTPKKSIDYSDLED